MDITDNLVKSQLRDDEVKSSRYKARKSGGERRTYLYAATTEDAAQHRRWTFYDVVINGQATDFTEITYGNDSYSI